ncbi:DUF4238 domain-containing protein [Jatrophihabitans sp. DSM 45814]
MARDHYLPAAFIGRFSDDTAGARRDRQIFVRRRDQTEVFSTTPSKIARVHDLYTMSKDDGPPDSVDEIWQAYESKIGPALDDLCNGKGISLNVWLRVLVPFITSKFVRGKDFDERFRRRPVIQTLQGTSVVEQDFNRARMMELQRLLAPVMAARWVVIHKTGGAPFLCNDLGLSATSDPSTGAQGWAVPLGPNDALGIFPRRQRTIARWGAMGWTAEIDHRDLPRVEVGSHNQALAIVTTEFMFGSSSRELRRAASFYPDARPNPELTMERWPQNHRLRLVHEYEWHRLVTASVKPFAALSKMRKPFQRITPDVLARGWHPVMILSVNLPEFLTGLSLNGESIRLDLHDVPGFTDSLGPPPWMQDTRAAWHQPPVARQGS